MHGHRFSFYPLVDSSAMDLAEDRLVYYWAIKKDSREHHCHLQARKCAVRNRAMAAFVEMPCLFALASLFSAHLVLPCDVVQALLVAGALFLLSETILTSSSRALQPY